MSRYSEPDFFMAETLNSLAGYPITRRAAGNSMAICPCHNGGREETPSLAIRWKGGRLVYNCYANCDGADILMAIRSMGFDPLTAERLDGSKTYAMPVSAPKPLSEEEKFKNEHTYDAYGNPTWLSSQWAWPKLTDPQDLRRYIYCDYDGHPLMTLTSCRRLNDKGKLKKYFIPVTPWRNNANPKRWRFPHYTSPEPRPPYGAETLKRPGAVFAAEGEKCRDAMNFILANRFAALSVYGSSPEYADLTRIAGRTLIILRDSDKVGLKYALELQRLHEGPSVTIEAPPNAAGARPDGWDIYDWVTEKDPKTGTKFDSRARALAFINYLRASIPLANWAEIEPYLNKTALSAA